MNRSRVDGGRRAGQRVVLSLYQQEIVKRTLDFTHLGTVVSFVRVFGTAAEKISVESPPAIREMQAELQGGLTAIVNRAITLEHWDVWSQRASGVRLLYTPKGFPQYEFAGPQMLFAQVLIWLADPKLYDLCQCQLKKCGKFFLAKRPARGRPRRRYCTTKHMKEANQADAANRVGRSRERHRRAAKHHK